jgi:abnormal spindle-like microcephaly-associated protein
VCAQAEIPIDNFSHSFGDGRALCAIINHYHPRLLPLDRLHETTRTSASDCSFGNKGYLKLLDGERANFKIANEAMLSLGSIPALLTCDGDTSGRAKTNNGVVIGKSSSSEAGFSTINLPDPNIMVTSLTYLCARLMDCSAEIRATITLQAAWRSYYWKKREVQAAGAIIKVQSFFRGYQVRKWSQFSADVAVRIQSLWRGVFVRKQLRKMAVERAKLLEQAKLLRSLAASRIQVCWNQYKAKLAFRIETNAATKIQTAYRAAVCFNQYMWSQYYIVLLQARIRSFLLSQNFFNMRKNVMTIQNNFRAYRGRKRAMEETWIRNSLNHGIHAYFKIVNKNRTVAMHNSATKIQSWARMHAAKKYLCWTQTRLCSNNSSKMRAWIFYTSYPAYSTRSFALHSKVRAKKDCSNCIREDSIFNFSPSKLYTQLDCTTKIHFF